VTLGRSGASCAGAISPRAPIYKAASASERFLWVPKWRKAPRSFGNRRPSRGGGGRGPRPCPPPRGGVSSPREARMRRPGCSRERCEEGSSPVKRQVLRSAALGPCRLRKRLARLVFTAVPSAKADSSVKTWVRRSCESRGEQGAAASRNSRARFERSKGVPARRVVCCRNRQASPGPDKREHGPLLTERPIHVDGV